MKNYNVNTRFVFEGIFKVKAESKEQAQEHVEKHCGLVIGGDIHSTLPDELINWDFNVHPVKEIISVKHFLDSKQEVEILNQINQFSCILAEKALIDKYNLLPEDFANEDGNYLDEYQDEFDEYYDHYHEKLSNLIGIC